MPLPHRQIKPTRIAFANLSKLQVFHNLRSFRHQIFEGTAKR
ncbi:Mobile element protein [Candidatus Enterovibrio escicola]|uniref:Mobile element protein n=1 Tax=Candidatus Enterovibrio escicola TaxID=1927127 RepID=A0A2A5T7L9_9GAMM|nr:Mobile element protein [Candidatus Enterovibrio escacola]